MGAMFSSGASDAELIEALKTPNVLVVDSRSCGEFKRGDAFQGAINIPVDSTEDRIAELGSDKDRQIITYCVMGVRAGRAAETIRAAGFNKVLSTTSADRLREVAQQVSK